jgi:hypothetical protein
MTAGTSSLIRINATRQTAWQLAFMTDAEHLTDAEYLLDRAARLRDLARRARHPQHRCYLVWRAAEAALMAETLEGTAKARPDEVEADTGGLVKAC